MIGQGGFEDLFILSPPHCGTTAMAKMLLGSPRIWSRIANAEGQKLPESAPDLSATPWDHREAADWPALQAIWEQGRPPGSIFLEKLARRMLKEHASEEMAYRGY